MLKKLKAEIIECLGQSENLQGVLIVKDEWKSPNVFLKPTVLISFGAAQICGNIIRNCETKLVFSVFVPANLKKILCDEIAFSVADEMLKYGAENIKIDEGNKHDFKTNCFVKTLSCELGFSFADGELLKKGCSEIVLMNGEEVFGKASECKVGVKRKPLEVERFGEIHTSDFVSANLDFLLELNQIVIDESQVRIYDIEKFEVLIKNHRFYETFYDCTWIEFNDNHIAEGCFEKITLVSKKRRKICVERDG
ncbi:hypothetical protein FACS1894198_6760 [Clostridia bacterium]|nr:hypothetical protein FACS1894198_6760 [Clostridia bacterium]